MGEPTRDVVTTLKERGLVHQATSEDLGELSTRETLKGYIGFDPTADSLHAGSLYQVMLLSHLSRAGHRPIALMGGGTGIIGDPSGRSSERTLIDSELLATNLEAMGRQVGGLLENAGADYEIIDNADWLGRESLIDFLRDVGKHFTVNTMMAKESVRARLEDRDQGISYTEFTYMLLQAYDFYRLHEDHGCRLQLGGSDQWGNIVAGIDLIRRRSGKEAFGLTSPLLLNAAGEKFGKSVDGAVWLDAKRTSPWKFHQFWINQPDAEASKLLAAYTFLPMEEVNSLRAEHAEAPHRRLMQQRVAREVTSLVHGSDACDRAENAAAVLFGKGDLRSLDAGTLEEVFADVPGMERTRDQVLRGDGAVRELFTDPGPALCASASDFWRKLKEGSLYVNGDRLPAAERGDEPVLSENELIDGRVAVLRRGKKDHALVRIVEG
ncbi:MAG: tyrosine--tRNA ligase [Planctomycetota bacterium]|jgi:tyrosyl-tRNA synthetase